MAKQKRKSIGAGATDLITQNGNSSFTKSRVPDLSVSRKAENPISRKKGRLAVRKLTVDVPESVLNEYEQLFLEVSSQYLKQNRRKLKRVDYAPLVLKYGLDRKRISEALATA